MSQLSNLVSHTSNIVIAGVQGLLTKPTDILHHWKWDTSSAVKQKFHKPLSIVMKLFHLTIFFFIWVHLLLQLCITFDTAAMFSQQQAEQGVFFFLQG